MAITLDQARAIVAGTSPPDLAPNPQEEEQDYPDTPPTSGGTDYHKGADGLWRDQDNQVGQQWIQDYFNNLESTGTNPLAGTSPLTKDPNYYISNPAISPNATRFVDQYGNILNEQGKPVTVNEYNRLVEQYGGGTLGGGGSSGFDTGPGYLNLAERQFGASEAQRAIENAMNFQQLLNAQKVMDQNILEQNRQFGRQQITENRGELGQRAGVGLGAGNLGLNLAQFNAQQANSPSNFPGYLAGLAGANTAGNPLTQLLGEGFQISGQPSPLANPQYQNMYDSLLNYGTVPDPAGVDAVQQAFNTDEAAARQFFAQKPEDLQRMFGTVPMATGGSFLAGLPSIASIKQQQFRSPAYTTPNPRVAGPVTINDMATQKPLAMAGEAGPEQIDVSPLVPKGLPPISAQSAQPMLGGGPTYNPAQGTSVALGQALKPLGSVPKPILDTLLGGGALTPNVVGMLLANPNLPPSLRELLAASIRSRLGESGLQDYEFQAGRFQLPGLGYGQTYVGH